MEVTTLGRMARQASAIPRRGLVLVGSALFGGLAPLFAGDTPARRKKKKKCKKPKVRCGRKCCAPGECRFKKKGKRWNLKANCTITRSIVLPKGVTLDGRGKTITMAGTKSGYTVAGVFAIAGVANVVNLTIDGAGLTEPCAVTAGEQPDPGGIHFAQTSGRIENVTITNVNCTNAISATINEFSAAQSVEVVGTRVTVTPPPDRAGVGINFGSSGAGRLTASIADCDFTSAAMLFNTNVDATVDGCTMAAGFIGGLHGARVTVQNSTITDAGLGVSGEGANTTMTITGNTIVGPGAITTFVPIGIDFRPGSTGSVSNNAISNYFVDGPSPSIGCGIRVDAGAGPVNIGTNNFPPPGNEQDVCLSD